MTLSVSSQSPPYPRPGCLSHCMLMPTGPSRMYCAPYERRSWRVQPNVSSPWSLEASWRITRADALYGEPHMTPAMSGSCERCRMPEHMKALAEQATRVVSQAWTQGTKREQRTSRRAGKDRVACI